MSQIEIDTTSPLLSDRNRVAQQNGPSFNLWMPASAVAPVVMLFACPVNSSAPVLASAGVLFLTPVVFLLAWAAGMKLFGLSCKPARDIGPNMRLDYLLPALLAAGAALGYLGGWWWWLFAPAVSFLGHRKGTQRAWWNEVVTLAWVFRDDGMGEPLAATDAEALAKAAKAINEEIGCRPRAGA